MRKIGGYIKKFLKGIKNTVTAVLKGELLLRLRIDRFFIHILYTFLMFWVVILVSMMVQNTLVKVERNRAVIKDLKIYKAQKTVELVSLGRMENVKGNLLEKGSEVTSPGKPAHLID